MKDLTVRTERLNGASWRPKTPAWRRASSLLGGSEARDPARGVGPDGSVSATRQRHAIGSGMLYTWCRQALAGDLTGAKRTPPAFAEVEVSVLTAPVSADKVRQVRHNPENQRAILFSGGYVVVFRSMIGDVLAWLTAERPRQWSEAFPVSYVYLNP